MNVEAYDLDSLRKLVRSLQDENRRLKELLDKADIAYESAEILCPTIYLMAYSSTPYFFAILTKCFRPSCGL